MASAPYLATKAALTTYIKQELGFPVVNIEITDDQINNQINKSIERFVEVGYGGSQARMIMLTTEVGKQEYLMPYDILSVLRVFKKDEVIAGFGTSSDLFSVNQYLAIDILKGGFTQGSLLSIEAFNQWSATIDAKLSIKVDFDYNTSTKNFYLWHKPVGIETYAIIVWEAIDYLSPEDSNIFDQRWVKAYAVELCRQQWGYNLTKYDGSTLPAGLQLNAAGLIQEANANIEKLELDLKEMYQLPPDFFIG